MDSISIDYRSDHEGPRFLAIGGAASAHDHVHRTVTSWPGWRRSGAQGALSRYRAPAYPASVLAVDQKALTVSWTPRATKARDEILGELQAARTALAHPARLTNVHGRLPTPRVPMDHQWAAIEALRHMGWRALIADDMGLGKTSAALWAALDAGVRTIVILCPVSVKHNWKREIAQTIGEDWFVQIIGGTPKKRATQFAEVANAARSDQRTACICNYDVLPWLPADQLELLRTLASGELLICDESHYLKSRKAKRTICTTFVAEFAKHRILLTGTPVRNLIDDLYQQVEIIRPGTWTSFHDFSRRHLVITPIDYGSGRPVQKITGVKNIEALNAVVNTLQIRRHKQDVLNLPPKIHTYPQIELDDDTRRVYRAMKDFAKIQLSELAPDTSIFDPQAKSAVETVMRCEQIAQGFVGGIPEPLMHKLSAKVLRHATKIPGRPNELLFPKGAKIAWLVETIEDILAQGGHPVVFTRFNAPLFWLEHELGQREVKGVSVLHGGLSAEEKDEAITGFQDGGNVLIAQVKMAEGWNATRSQDVIFLGRDWSPAINSQAEDRAYRIGQKGTVNVQIPVVLDTIEIPIHRRLQAKADAAENALRTVTIGQLAEML